MESCQPLRLLPVGAMEGGDDFPQSADDEGDDEPTGRIGVDGMASIKMYFVRQR